MSARFDARCRFPSVIEEGQRGGRGRRTGTEWKGRLAVFLTLAALVACGTPVGPEGRSDAGPSAIEDLPGRVAGGLVCPLVAPVPSDDDRIAFMTDRHGGQNPAYDGHPAWWR